MPTVIYKNQPTGRPVNGATGKACSVVADFFPHQELLPSLFLIYHLLPIFNTYV